MSQKKQNNTYPLALVVLLVTIGGFIGGTLGPGAVLICAGILAWALALFIGLMGSFRIIKGGKLDWRVILGFVILLVVVGLALVRHQETWGLILLLISEP